MKSLMMQTLNHASGKPIEFSKEHMTVERIGLESFLLPDGFELRIFLNR